MLQACLQVMILDWDVHHGNGTNDLFYDDDSVLMVDMHEDGVWPGSGQLQETGTGRGQGYTINIPMPSALCSPLASVYHRQQTSSILAASWGTLAFLQSRNLLLVPGLTRARPKTQVKETC